jgi:hypothetical protein
LPIKLPAERLKRALLSGLDVTALDALFGWHQRIAAEVSRLKKRE